MYTIDFFKDELAAIKDDSLRDWTRRVLEQAPAYFWTAPASITGNHHPVDDNVEGGLCQHSAKASWIGAKLAECHEDSPDIFLIAGLTHDIRRYGAKDTIGSYDDYAIHPEAAADWLEKIPIETACQRTEVANLVRTHSGIYGNIHPASYPQWLFHYADVMASMPHFVALKFYDPNAEAPDPIVTKQRFSEDKEGYRVFKFGKYDGRRVQDVLTKNPRYIDWLIENMDEDKVKDVLREEQKRYRERLVHPGELPGVNE